MVFSSEQDNMRVVIGDCNCGCNSEIHISTFTDEPNREYSLSLHSSKWYEEQHGIFWIIKTRLKRAFYSLIGKDYLYMDIIFNEQEFEDFITALEIMSEKQQNL